ncbi:MAG: SIR2 family protein [Nitrospirota bacterium]|nr:SIR2 family protein [Nitrospirota bacterium]
MPLEITTIVRSLQDHLQEGLLMVVGTGLSIAEGVPGMGTLAAYLKAEMPKKLLTEPDSGWDAIVASLDAGDHLEAAMEKVTLKSTTVESIVSITTDLILEAEQSVFKRVLNGERQLPFTTFIKHLMRAGKQFHLITPNYDRLIEFATEAAEVGVNSRFTGYLHGHSDPRKAADAHREAYYAGKNAAFRPLRCLCVHKPHGSLDWFEVDGKLVRCPVNIGKAPLIITPGASKYRESFRWAFDEQRTSGNKAATNATRLMFIGYGFNDDHLEQYVCPGLKLTKPTLIIAKELTTNAMKIVENSKDSEVIVLTSVSATDYRTRIITSSGEELVVDDQLWNLEGFNKGVL